MIFYRWLLLILLFYSSGFCFEVKTIPTISPTAFLKWDLLRGPVAVSLDQRGSADLKFAQTEQALVSALNVWQNVPGQRVQFQYDGVVSLQSASGTDEINSVQWIESGWDYSSHAIAVTSYSYYLQDPPVLIDADIFMNGQNYKWTAGTADSTTIDAQQTLIHELGHLLGISHTGVTSAQMFPYLSGTTNHKLMRDDKAALRFLYGTPNSTFVPVTPIRRARYAANLSREGLPLPVFRWNDGPDSNYTVEFSNSTTFAKTIRVRTTPYPFYQLTSTMERKMLRRSGNGKIFWRVRSGGAVSGFRPFRLQSES